MTGIVILGVALVVAAGFGLLRRARDGEFRDASAVEEARQRRHGSAVEEARQRRHETPDRQVSEVWGHVTAALPEVSLGGRATLVQFSSAFCAPCRTTRVVLADVAEREDGVRHLEIDAEKHLDLVRALDVRRTPTTLVLDSRGREIARATGAPQRAQVLSSLPTGVAS